MAPKLAAEANEKRKEVESRMFPVREVEYRAEPGLPAILIEMRPMAGLLLPKALNFIFGTIGQMASGQMFLGNSSDQEIEKLYAALDKCLTVVDAPEMKCNDLSTDCIADLIPVFLEQAIRPGKLEALKAEIETKYGIPLTFRVEEKPVQSEA